jgi:hypothetical protein
MAEAVGEPSRRPGDDRRERRPRQRRRAGLQHRVAPDRGEEDDVAEDQREEGGGEEQGAEVADAEGAVGEEGRLDDRACVRAAAPDHPAEQRRRGREAAERRRCGPAPVVALDDRQRDQGQAQRQHQRAGQVGEAAVEVGTLAQAPAAEPHHGRPQRQVYEEDEAPVGELDQGAAEGRADRSSRSRSGPPNANPGGAALGRKGIEDQRQRGRRDQRRADALHDPEGDQQLERGRNRAEQARPREPGDAEQEDPLVPEPVGQSTGRHEQSGDDDEVAVEDPRERVPPRPREGARDVREGDIDDRGVEEGEEGAGAGDRHRTSMTTVIHRSGL